MKPNRTIIQLVLILITISIMGLILWGIGSGALLDHKETRKQMYLRGVD